MNGPGVRAGLREAPPAKSRRHGVKPPAPSPIGNVRRFFPGVSSAREKAPTGPRRRRVSVGSEAFRRSSTDAEGRS